MMRVPACPVIWEKCDAIMMIERTLAITAEEFFECVVGEFQGMYRELMDDELACGKVAEGFSFTANEGERFAERRVELVRYEPLRVWELCSCGAMERSVTRYEVEPEVLARPQGEAESIRVRFTCEASNISERAGVGRLISEAFYLGRMSDHLYKMQDDVLDARAGGAVPRAMGLGIEPGAGRRIPPRLLRRMMERQGA